MYKIGDKLICKKDYYSLLKNFEYNVRGSNNNGAFLVGIYWFYTFGEEDNIYDYFYTKGELRLQKLKQLECTSLIDTEK